jgi:ribonuclease P protein component
MLNRKNRMGSSEAIERLAKSGNVFKSDFLLFRYSGTEADSSRFAVNVSKKIFKNAVPRNRLRRQVNEAIRLNLPALKRNVDVLISARGAAAQSPSYKELSRAVLAFINFLNQHAK